MDTKGSIREKIAGTPIKVHRYRGKTYLALDSIDQILSYQSEEIEKEQLTDEEIKQVYEDTYHRAIEFSEKYETVLSAKNYSPNRPADRQRVFNSHYKDEIMKAIAQAQLQKILALLK